MSLENVNVLGKWSVFVLLAVVLSTLPGVYTI